MKIVLRISALYIRSLETKPKLDYKRGCINKFYLYLSRLVAIWAVTTSITPAALSNCPLSHALYALEGLELMVLSNTICA